MPIVVLSLQVSVIKDAYNNEITGLLALSTIWHETNLTNISDNETFNRDNSEDKHSIKDKDNINRQLTLGEERARQR